MDNHEGIARVRAALAAAGIEDRTRLFAEPARTSPEAAQALACDVAQIAKSIVFRGEGDRPVLVVASGANRVDESKVAALLGYGLGKANAAYVREVSGFVIGGVSPIGWLTQPAVLLDRDLLALRECWAAAGHPNAMMRLTSDELQRLTQASAADIAA
ncbi:YbaK/EbsC family protein [Lacibacterium aquatile]|uniref:YbaK/EbsC family protein n=1 Tax=Lacibacterium aquatile TaxID=1168082 RepID=A0ABW5DUK3_9PROT